LPDLRELLRNELAGHRETMKDYAQSLKQGRKQLGPRQRTKLHEHVMNIDVKESLPIIEQMYAAAKHQEGEARPCAACKFLGSK